MEIVLALMPLLVEVINLLLPIVSILIGLLGEMLVEFVNMIAPVLQVISEALTPLISTLGQLVDFLVLALKPVILMIQGLFQGVFTSMVEFVSNQIQRLISIFNNLVDFFKNVFTGNFSGAFMNLAKILGNIFAIMAENLLRPINFIIGAINGMLSGLDGIKIPDWVPAIGGKDFSFGFRITSLNNLLENFSDCSSKYSIASFVNMANILDSYPNNLYSSWFIFKPTKSVAY